eukprot:TRINITY_DN69842_c0_g1_i1.p1 TRINITY_DN69842_c0_g1~~TRINITY_DN69842_c0_g1_i1.p1  ORF type:complete len:1148 (+),score=279.66 TRINITY_DN69842_c0_g1_i1:66-3446(+)
MPPIRLITLLNERQPVTIEQEGSVGELRALVRQAHGISDDQDVHLYFNRAALMDDSQGLTAAGIGPGSLITILSKALAEEHGKNSHVRSVKSAFEDLKEIGEDGDAERKALLMTEPFDMNCSIYELSELGAGWVLFFEFILFLIVLCIVCFLIQMPALITWSRMNNLHLWSGADRNATNNGMVTRAFMSSGNAGPDGLDSPVPGWCSLSMAVVTLVASAHYARRQGVVKQEVDAREIDPNDFALFVEGLPEDTTEAEVKEFVEEHACETRHTEVVTIVLGYDIAAFKELRASYAQAVKAYTEAREAAVAAEERLKSGAVHAAVAQQELQQAKEVLGKHTEECKQLVQHLSTTDALKGYLRCTGSAVAVLRSQKEHRRSLDYWDTWFETFSTMSSCLASFSGKPKFRDQHRVQISRAANPSNIMWENIDFKDRNKERARVYGYLTLIFLVCFLLVWGINTATGGRDNGTGSSIACSLALMTANATASVTIKLLVMKERHATQTESHRAVMAKLAIFYGMVYSLIPLMCNLNPGQDWYVKKGLLADQWTLMFMNAFIWPLFIRLDLKACLKRLQVWKTDPGNSPGMTQAVYEKLFEPPEMDPANAYAKVFKSFLLGLLYSPMVPWALFITAIALALEFVAYKHQLLRQAKRPYRQGHEVSYAALRLVCFSVAIFAVFQWMFLDPSLTPERKKLVDYMVLPLIAVSFFFILAPAKARQYLLLTCFCQKIKKDTSSRVDYYTAQRFWPKHQKYNCTNLVYLQLESIMVKETAKHPGTKPAWDPKTGNFSDPLEAASSAEPAPLPAAATGSTSGPAAGTLAGGAAPAGTPDAPDGSHVLPAPESGEGGGADDMEEVPLAEDTAAVAEADPMALALEEEKFHGMAGLMEGMGGGDESGDETEAESSGDEGDESGSEEDSSGDEEDPGEHEAAAALWGPFGPPRAGMRARVMNLTSKPEFNGQVCIIRQKTKEGWLVLLHTGKQARLPAGCIEPLWRAIQPGSRVRVSGLEAEAAQIYNGTVAKAISFDMSSYKWKVKMCDGKEASIPCDKLELLREGGAASPEATPKFTPGMKVRIQGLAAAKGQQYNDTVALVLAWEPSLGKASADKVLVKLFTGMKAPLPADKLVVEASG